MVFVGLFLKYIFLVVMLCALFFVGIIVYFWLRIKHAARNFQNRAANAGMHGHGAHTRQQRQTAAGGNDYGNEQLYDERSEAEANRKIFSKDEGEYVDFEEEK